VTLFNGEKPPVLFVSLVLLKSFWFCEQLIVFKTGGDKKIKIKVKKVSLKTAG